MIWKLALLVNIVVVQAVDPLVHVSSLTNGLQGPARVNVADDGTVLVADPDSDLITRFDSAGVFLGHWSVPTGPLDIAAHEDGRYFVSLRDTSEVAIYDSGFVRIGTLGVGNPLVTFVRPTDIDIATDTGRIYVVDGEGDRVYGFESDGTLAVFFGIRGTGNGQFKYPSAIAVDEPRGRLIVADHDNFRIQTFTTSGVFKRRFGYRIKFTSQGDEGWMPRTLGVDVDSTGRIYVTDALMGTVRIFDALGSELDKVVTYGSNPGELRVPSDVSLSWDESRVYVVSTSTGSVEVYDTPTFAAPIPQNTPARGWNASALDVDRQRGVRDNWMGRNKSFFPNTWSKSGKRGSSTVLSSGSALTQMTNFEGPHMIEGPVICGRCHGIPDQPGGHLGLVEGQGALCLSCHNTAGAGLNIPSSELDIADPYGTNPAAADGRGRSHAWGVPAVNAAADSIGPLAGGLMERYLDGGLIKCATCHNQHSNDYGAPYLRTPNTGDAMCKECHAPRNEGPGERGTHPVGFAYPGGTGEFPSQAAVSPLVIKAGKVECMTCHTPHEADSGGANGGAGDGMLLRSANDETLCKTCHTNHIGHTAGGSWQPTCNDCHNAHDPSSMNLSLIAQTVLNQTLGLDLPVVFTALSGANSFDDGDPAVNDGICQVCHTATTYHRQDGSGVAHNDGQNCTVCHPHSTGFMPAGGSSCIACHSNPQDNGDGIPLGGRQPVVNADGSGGHHLVGGVLTDGDCVTCHEMTQHQAGQVRLWSDPTNPVTPLPVTGNPTELVAFCESCHTGADHPIIHTTSAAWVPVCTECHELHDPANTNLFLVNDVVRNETLTVDKPVVFSALTGPNSFDDGDPAVNDGICQVCHTATNFHLHNGMGTPHNNGENCTTCHPHGSGFLPTAAPSCIACHSNPQDNGDGIPVGGRQPVVNADGSGGHHLAGAVMTDADCATCHEMTQHQLGTVRLWSDPNNPVTPLPLTGDPTEVEVFCINCHSSVDHPIIHTTGAAWEPTCLQCHELHDPANANLFLVNNIVRNETLAVDKPVVFSTLTGPNSFDDGDPAVNDGICQVCHTATTYHLQDGSGVAHNNATNCTTCHPHKDGFLPTNASCQDCHQVAQGPRRVVIAEFGLASHHLQGALDDADCVVCHDMSQHQQGQVRLKNVDDPTNPAAVVALAGDPTTSSVEAAKLDVFCLACHDADAAGGVNPFTDGVTPLSIDSTAWALSSHRMTPMSCYGNGETFGCHSSGHGSAKRKMLAPADASQTQIAGDALREEEGMCYTCHDADGPAGTDVLATFGLSTHHNVSSLEQIDGSKVECTHCHNPHIANATNLLADPDAGSLTPWAGTQADFCVVCHDGAPPVGVTFPATSAGTGYNKSMFAGTTHATQLGPDSCTHCHDQHGSQYVSILRRNYVMADNNPWSAGDGDYEACWLCHNEDETVLQTNAFGSRHRKHVQSADAPCIICHDVHGGADVNEPGLINFDFAVNNGYDIQYVNNNDASSSFYLNGAGTQGNCLLTCHSKNHLPKNYNRQPNPVVDCSVCHPTPP